MDGLLFIKGSLIKIHQDACVRGDRFKSTRYISQAYWDRHAPSWAIREMVSKFYSLIANFQLRAKSLRAVSRIYCSTVPSPKTVSSSQLSAIVHHSTVLIHGTRSKTMTKKDMDIFTNLEVEPPSWCGIATGKMAAGLEDGGRSGDIMNYDEHVVMDYRNSKL